MCDSLWCDADDDDDDDDDDQTAINRRPHWLDVWLNQWTPSPKVA